MAKYEHVVYRGEKFWLQTTGRYFQSRRKGEVERLLHRRIWSDRHGPIPEGMVVHHIDGDWRNNDIANLALLSHSEHAAEHMRERLALPGAAERNAEWLDRARIAAAEWHGSDEGLAWHREHGKQTWEGRDPVDAVCSKCGATFQTYFPSRARFCSTACMQAVAFRRYFTEQRTCAWCGVEFMANRHRKTACCSRVCGNRLRGVIMRKAT